MGILKKLQGGCYIMNNTATLFLDKTATLLFVVFFSSLLFLLPFTEVSFLSLSIKCYNKIQSVNVKAL